MSFESGRKLGLLSSLIFVIAPVVAVVLDGFLFFSLISAFSRTISNGATTVGTPILSIGVIWVTLVAIGLASLLGLIMFIVSMYQLSHYYNEPGIFKNIVYALIVIAAGVATYAAVLIASLISAAANSRATTTTPQTGLLLFGFLGVFGIFFVVVVLGTFFCKRAFDKLGEKSGVHSFDTAGLLILIGVIIPVVSWVGWIFALSGFNSLKAKSPESSSTYYTVPAAPPTTMQNKYCPYCGTSNNIDAAYCKNCGKQLQ